MLSCVVMCVMCVMCFMCVMYHVSCVMCHESFLPKHRGIIVMAGVEAHICGVRLSAHPGVARISGLARHVSREYLLPSKQETSRGTV